MASPAESPQFLSTNDAMMSILSRRRREVWLHFGNHSQCPVFNDGTINSTTGRTHTPEAPRRMTKDRSPKTCIRSCPNARMHSLGTVILSVLIGLAFPVGSVAQTFPPAKSIAPSIELTDRRPARNDDIAKAMSASAARDMEAWQAAYDSTRQALTSAVIPLLNHSFGSWPVFRRSSGSDSADFSAPELLAVPTPESRPSYAPARKSNRKPPARTASQRSSRSALPDTANAYAPPEPEPPRPKAVPQAPVPAPQAPSGIELPDSLAPTRPPA